MFEDNFEFCFKLCIELVFRVVCLNFFVEPGRVDDRAALTYGLEFISGKTMLLVSIIRAIGDLTSSRT